MARKIRSAASLSLKDTRGLPFGMDPRMFYVYSSQKRRQEATGLEGLLYKYLPQNLISSLAFAIDPLSQFKVSATRISGTSRIRTKTQQSSLDYRGYDRLRQTTVAPYKYLPGGFVDSHAGSSESVPQGPLINRSEDVTKGDRPIDSDMGEFSKWEVQPFSSSRSIIQHDNQERWYEDYPSGYHYIQRGFESFTGYGPAAWISKYDVESIRADVWGRQAAVMQSNALGLYRGCSSQRKATTLFRNVVELRDIPRSILQLQETLKNLQTFSNVKNIPHSLLERLHSFKTNVRDIPKEYVSYMFGWRQTYSDIRELVLAPEKIGKRINFLIRRNGKATTYRLQKVIPEGSVPSSGFSYTVYPGETVIGNDSNITMNHTLKMVISTTFEFPDVDLPSFRTKEYYRQLGVVPSITDLYNLTPWTWLFDWFTGFGKYVEIIDSINNDKDLINWGLLSCLTEGEVATTYSAKIQNSDSHGTEPTSFTYPVSGHTSILRFKSHLRRDASGLLNVRSAGEPTQLNAYQLSILGALFHIKGRF
jgi:hypothetical protein